LVSELIFDFVTDGSVIRSVEFVPPCFMYSQKEVEGSVSKGIELGDCVAISVGYVSLPNELSNLDEGT